MPARILAVTDLSAASDVALEAAHRRARDSGASLAVVHGLPTLAAVRPLFPQRVADDALRVAELPVRAETLLRERLERVGAGSAEVFIEHGPTAEVALRVAETWRPDLLVVGAPEGGPTDAERLTRHFRGPVLVARPERGSRRVVAGTDLSDPSYPAIRAGAAEAARLGGALTVVHAIEPIPIALYGLEVAAAIPTTTVAEVRAAHESRLAETIRELGVTAEAIVHEASPAEALVGIAGTLEADLLVVGTHGRSGLTRFLLGSVAESVVRRAPCSVLVVHLA